MIIYPFTSRRVGPGDFVRGADSYVAFMVWTMAFGRRETSTYSPTTIGFADDLDRWFRGYVDYLWQMFNPDFKAELGFSEDANPLPMVMTFSRPGHPSAQVHFTWTVEEVVVGSSSVDLKSPQWLDGLLVAIQDAAEAYFGSSSPKEVSK